MSNFSEELHQSSSIDYVIIELRGGKSIPFIDGALHWVDGKSSSYSIHRWRFTLSSWKSAPYCHRCSWNCSWKETTTNNWKSCTLPHPPARSCTNAHSPTPTRTHPNPPAPTHIQPHPPAPPALNRTHTLPNPPAPTRT